MKWNFLNPRYTPHELALQMLIAIQENHITGVNSWLRRGADPNSKIKSNSAPPLHHAAYSAGVPVILLLLASGAKINGKDVYGKTAAHSSIRADRSDANLRQLLASGADPTATCKAGLSLLHMAIKERNSDCIVTLFNAGLDLDALKPSFYSRSSHALISLFKRGESSRTRESDEYGYYAREHFNDPEIGPLLRSHILRRKALQAISEDKKPFFKWRP